ncbi:MAG: aldose 1-epimerase, partial [Oscillospiraceae bacterium]|nr:aldose 1-epimerase [Oscillospiraceae bacterium]
MNTTQQTTLNGTPCIMLSAGGYEAYIAYEIGSNVIRLRDVKHNIDVFRYSPDNTAETLKQSAEVWGLPTLYLPNRFADGILKTSDAVYQLPLNEPDPYHNHIHGFLHKRIHTVIAHHADENGAVVKTEYIYDENDPFFPYLPLKFRAELTFTLS